MTHVRSSSVCGWISRRAASTHDRIRRHEGLIVHGNFCYRYELLFGRLNVPIVQRSGRGPFKAETRVRFPMGTPAFADRSLRSLLRLAGQGGRSVGRPPLGLASHRAQAKAARQSLRSKRRWAVCVESPTVELAESATHSGMLTSFSPTFRTDCRDLFLQPAPKQWRAEALRLRPEQCSATASLLRGSHCGCRLQAGGSQLGPRTVHGRCLPLEPYSASRVPRRTTRDEVRAI